MNSIVRLLLASSALLHAQPNVLLISIDDLNDWVGCLRGHPQALTPNLDRLAERGTLFANAHCQSPVCNPSRASMMTGRYPHTSGVYFLGPDLKKAPALQKLPTLPEVFAQNSYQTLAAGKIFHTGTKRFFQEYGGDFGAFGPTPPQKISQPHGHPLWDWGAYPARDEDMPDYQVASWAIAELKKEREKPFFLAVGFWRPHVPMCVPQKWFDLFPIEQIELPKASKDDLADISPYAQDLVSLKHVSPTHEWILSAEKWKSAVQSYLASVAFVDHQLGRVLDAFDESPHKKDTIIVLFSDHGFHLGEKEHWAKRTLWEDGTRVPLIITAPGFARNQRSEQPAELLDVFPTLLELANLPKDEAQEGQSLVPLLKNPEADWDHPALTSFGPGNTSIRTREARYIRYRDDSEEFYNHLTDPHEQKNLLAPENVTPIYRKLAQSLARELDQLVREEAPVLGKGSTGHQAFHAAEENLKKETP